MCGSVYMCNGTGVSIVYVEKGNNNYTVVTNFAFYERFGFSFLFDFSFVFCPSSEVRWLFCCSTIYYSIDHDYFLLLRNVTLIKIIIISYILHYQINTIY